MEHGISPLVLAPVYVAMILVNSTRPTNKGAVLLGFVGLILAWLTAQSLIPTISISIHSGVLLLYIAYQQMSRLWDKHKESQANEKTRAEKEAANNAKKTKPFRIGTGRNQYSRRRR